MKNSRVAVFVFLLAIVFSSHSIFGENWKTSVASPSYGFGLGWIELASEDGGAQTTVLLPGIELRHFAGINVTENGRFYCGFELGASIHFGMPDDTEFPTADPHEYTLDSVLAGSIFLMAKHGYRWEFGEAPGSLGAGLEIGLGAMGGGGMMSFRNEDNDEAGYDEGIFSPVFELGGEFSMRLEQNLRFISRLGLMAGIPLIDGDVPEAGLSGSMAPVRVNLRFGFVRDH